MGAFDRNDSEESMENWHYDMYAGLLCRNCQVAPTYQLVPVWHDIWTTFRRMIEMRAFHDSIPLDHFDDINEEMEPLERACNGVARSCLWRLERINQDTARGGSIMIRMLVRNRRDTECDHCGCEAARPLVTCQACGIAQWCSSSSDANDCARDASIYHAPICATLQAGVLLDIDNAWYICMHEVPGSTLPAWQLVLSDLLQQK